MKQELRDREGPKTRRFSLPALIATGLLSALAAALALLLVAGNLLGSEGFSLLQAAFLVKSQFVGEYDSGEVMDATLDGMVTALGDRWSYYLSPQEYVQVTQTRANEFVGVGVTVTSRDEEDIYILSVMEDSPAQKAGIQPGEYIRGVDGVIVTGENRQDRVDAIGGPVGEAVTLEIEGTDGLRRVVEIVRDTVHTVSVTSQLLEDGTGLVTIKNFYEGSGATMETLVGQLVDQGAKRLVFDARDNPGGYVSEVTRMLDYLLPEGDIFVQEDRSGRETVYTSDPDRVDLPMGVLVDQDSYSAAELFAAQLRESVGAVVAGAQTSGKGYAQQLFPLANGGGLGISTSRYFTGGRQSLIGVGLNPEPLVELSQEERVLLYTGQLPHQEDRQLQALLRAMDQAGA